MAGPSIASIAFDATYSTAKDFSTKHPNLSGSIDRDALTELLEAAIGNKDIPSRAILANQFLDMGADPTRVDRERANILHGYAQHLKDPAAEAPLLKRLLDMGADPNQHAPRYGWPLEIMMHLVQLNEQQLAPVYDVWFTHPGLDFLTPGSPLTLWDKTWLARGNSPHLLERVRRYITDHTGAPPPTPQYARRQPDKTWLTYDHGQQTEQGPDGFWHVVTQ